jgi:excisionase family DNA binding protein
MTPELTGYNEQLLTPQEVARWLNVKLSTIYKWSAMGYIPCVKLGGKIQGSIRFIRIEIIRWVKRRARRGRSMYKLGTDDVELNG